MKAFLQPLEGKYYDTKIQVWLDAKTSVWISISGGNSPASQREIDQGWEVEDGMDHIESQATYEVAQRIIKALNE